MNMHVITANIKCLTNDMECYCTALKSVLIPIHFIPWRNSLTVTDNHTCLVFAL